MSRFGKGEGVARVVCVHGVGQQRETETTLHRGWAPALCGGVQLAGDRLGEHEVRCAAYGDLFRLPGRALASGIRCNARRISTSSSEICSNCGGLRRRGPIRMLSPRTRGLWRGRRGVRKPRCVH